MRFPLKLGAAGVPGVGIGTPMVVTTLDSEEDDESGASAIEVKGIETGAKMRNKEIKWTEGKT